jgi:lysozyme
MSFQSWLDWLTGRSPDHIITDPEVVEPAPVPPAVIDNVPPVKDATIDHGHMKMSAIGRAVLIGREGMMLNSYRDSKGIWTVGVGHTAACGPPIPGPGVSITAKQCEDLFAVDVAEFEIAMSKAIKRHPIYQHEFDAFVSIAFNVGHQGFSRSTAVRLFNAGDREAAAKAIMMWNKPAEILSRRRAERDQFLTPYSKAMPKARA